MADYSTSTMSIRDCRINVMRGGSGSPMLFLHGGGGVGIWLPCMARLAKKFDVIAPEPVLVRGDRAALERALANLVENARLHGRGRIVVEASSTRGVARLTVTDEGAGVAAGEAERLFERFRRGPDHGPGLRAAGPRRPRPSRPAPPPARTSRPDRDDPGHSRRDREDAAIRRATSAGAGARRRRTMTNTVRPVARSAVTSRPRLVSIATGISSSPLSPCSASAPSSSAKPATS